MEMNNLSHDARLWLSFDSPHQGANVAMYVQYLVNYLGNGYPDIDELKATVDGLLRSKAAQQMLIDHLDAHASRSEEHTSELQSRPHLVCRLLLEKKKKKKKIKNNNITKHK